MKSIKKLLALAISLTLALMLALPAFAAGTGSITINNPTAGNTYKLYKVFDADGVKNTDNEITAISYKVRSNHTSDTLPDGFVKDTAGNVYFGSESNGTITPSNDDLTAEQIASIGNYVTNADLIDTVVYNETNVTEVKFDNLDDGYYYITTTTGTAVTINSIGGENTITVNDKNEAPDLTKKIDSVDTGWLDQNGKNAVAQVGTDVDYVATITVKNGAKSYKFTDTIGTGLKLNDDVTVTVGNSTTSVETGPITYTKKISGNVLTLEFADSWINGENVGVDAVITIKYSAKITSDALTVDTGKNTASISYGENSQNTKSIPDNDVPHVYNASIVVKKWDTSNSQSKTALAGAGFVLSKTESGSTTYYKIADATAPATGKIVSWVPSIEDATEYTTSVDSSTNTATVTFTGLASGEYTLIEKTVPAGYNKAADQDITIAQSITEANLTQTAEVDNKTGSTLPSTGGMGTTLFYVLGGLLVAGAGVLLVTKRRMNGKD